MTRGMGMLDFIPFNLLLEIKTTHTSQFAENKNFFNFNTSLGLLLKATPKNDVHKCRSVIKLLKPRKDLFEQYLDSEKTKNQNMHKEIT